MAAFILPALVRKLLRSEPGIDIEIIASNSSSDLKRREADIAIRAFRPTQPDLIARRLSDVDAQLYATPAYLAELGEPATPVEFVDADFIGFNRRDVLIAALAKQGFTLSQRNFTVRTESHLVHWELTKQGIGIGVMPTEIADAEPLVRRILPDLEPLTSELWLVAHRELKTSRRIRTVFDFLATELA